MLACRVVMWSVRVCSTLRMKMWSGPACVLDTADEDVDLWMKKVPRCVTGAELSWRSMVIQPWEAHVEAQRRDCKGGGRRRARVGRKSGTATGGRGRQGRGGCEESERQGGKTGFADRTPRSG